MMLLLDFAEATKTRERWKKNQKKHGNQTNYKIDREYLSVNNNNNKKELDQNQESSPLKLVMDDSQNKNGGQHVW